MVKISDELLKNKWKSKMLLQVHDELLFDAHIDEIDQLKSLVKSQMEQAFNLEVPLIVDIGVGENWLEAH